MYMEFKHSEALMKVGGIKLFLSSRLNMNVPMHDKNGMVRMMWNLFGSSQMHKFGKKIDQKILSKGYSDVDHYFGIETMLMDAERNTKPLKCLKRIQRFLRLHLQHRHISANL